MGQLYNMLYPNRKNNFNISKEYSAVDFINFIPVFPLLYRQAFNKSETTINTPGALIYIFLGEWSQVAPYIQVALKTLAASISPLPILVPVLADVVYQLGEEYKTGYKQSLKSPIGKYKANIYHTLFINYKNNVNTDIEKLQEEFRVFKSLVKVIKKEICTKCEKRRLDPIEISQMKLFKPKEIEKEVMIAINYYSK